jgi:hypothetical protein
MSLEHLEAEFAESLECGICRQYGNHSPATHVALHRDYCTAGGDLTLCDPDRLLCIDHAKIMAHAMIPPGAYCYGCNKPVGGEPFTHYVRAIRPIRPS